MAMSQRDNLIDETNCTDLLLEWAVQHGDEAEVPPLYKTIDSLNARFSKRKVFSASEGIGERSWKMKHPKLSKRASTRRNEQMVVK